MNRHKQRIAEWMLQGCDGEGLENGAGQPLRASAVRGAARDVMDGPRLRRENAHLRRRLHQFLMMSIRGIGRQLWMLQWAAMWKNAAHFYRRADTDMGNKYFSMCEEADGLSHDKDCLVSEITELRETIARLREGRDLLEEKNTLQERRLDDLRDLSGRLLRGGGDDFHDGLAEAGKQMRICMSLSPQPPAPEASEAGELLLKCPRRDELCGECNMPAADECEWKTPDECSRCAHYDSEELCGLCRRRNPAANDDQWCEKGSTP